MLGVTARPVVGQGHRARWSRGLARAGVTPDMVTIVGTLGAVAGAVVLFGTGHLFWGTVAVTFFVLLDLLDGALARARGGGSVFGAVLDSAGDRAADAAIFGALVWWFSGAGRQPAAGPARAALPGARRPDLLHQGARRGRRALPATSASSSASSGCSWCCSAPGSPASACRTRCTSGLWVLLAAARSPSASGSSPSAAARRAAPALPVPPSRAVTGPLRRPARRPAPPTPGFAAGWHAVRMLPEPAARGAFDRAGRWAAGRDGQGHPPAAGQPAGGHRRPAGRAGARGAHHAGRCAPTPATGRRPSGCPTLSSERIVAGTEVARPRAPAEGARRRARAGHGAAAQRQLGRRRRLVRRLPRRPVHDRGRAAEAGVAVPPVPRLPRVPGLPGRAAHRRPAAEHRGAPRLAGRGRGRPACSSTATSAAAACRSTSSAGRRRCPAAAALLAAQTGAALSRPSASSPSAAGGWSFSPEIPVDGPGPAQGPGRPARCSRSPTRSPTSIAAQPEDWHMLGRIWPDVAADPPARASRPDAHRPGLPLPVGRPRRRPVPRPRPRRDPARPGPPRRGPHARPSTRSRCRRSGSPSPGAPCRSPTTARWPACSSARCRPPGCAAGCARGTSTSSTCTSRRRRRCPCWSA